MTKEEIINNYEFKLTKKTLLRQFPWIKDMVPSDDADSYKTLCFVEIIIDPYELGEQEGWEVASYVGHMGKITNTFMSPYLSTFFVHREGPSELEKEIENEMTMIHNTPAIPRDLKMDRRISPSTWKYIPTPKQSS